MCSSLGDAVAAHAAGWFGDSGSVPLVAISGAPGSGKSTLAGGLCQQLRSSGRRIVALSLDDFYLTRAERQSLSQRVHPLFATRGVPGTHDLALLAETLSSLGSGSGAVVPRFDKASDDRRPRADWHTVRSGQLDGILLEGWCLALPPQSARELAEPINALEREQDADGSWRRAVNDALCMGYKQLFAQFGHVIALLAPSFETVFRWRREQEQSLASKSNQTGRALLKSDEQLARFLALFERLTRHGLTQLPRLADLSIFLEESRHPRHVEHDSSAAARRLAGSDPLVS